MDIPHNVVKLEQRDIPIFLNALENLGLFDSTNMFEEARELGNRIRKEQREENKMKRLKGRRQYKAMTKRIKEKGLFLVEK